MFFRRLGVFAGGADLDAISVVTTDPDLDPVGDVDPFDLVAGLVDASLLTVTEGADGEPRIGMLETIRTYARDQLDASGELDMLQERHSRYYLTVAEQMKDLFDGEQYAQVRAQFEVELDNFRAALDATLQAGTLGDVDSNDGLVGLRLCIALGGFWHAGGYFSEDRRWLQRAIDHAGSRDSPELARCLTGLGACLVSIDHASARDHASAAVAMWRRLDDNRNLPLALTLLAAIEHEQGDAAVARSLYEEACGLARELDDKHQLLQALGHLSTLEADEHNIERSLELSGQAAAVARDIGELNRLLVLQHDAACTLREMGRFEEAHDLMHAEIPHVLRLNQPAMLVALAEDYAAVLAEVGDHHHAVGLFGAADAMRQRLTLPRYGLQEAELAGPIAITRHAISTQQWDEFYQRGCAMTIEDALNDAYAAKSSTLLFPAIEE